MFTFLPIPFLPIVSNKTPTINLLDPLEQFDVLAVPLPILWGIGISNLTLLLAFNLIVM